MFETWGFSSPVTDPGFRGHRPTVSPITVSNHSPLLLCPYALELGTLARWHGGHDLHFITCSCYRRQPLLGKSDRRDLFLKVLEQVRQRYKWVVIGYVVMPEHFHLLVSEPQERLLSTAMQALKLGFARRVLAEQTRLRRTAQLSEPGPQHIWESRYYDFNVCNGRKRVEKLRYMHRNPVKRGLVEAPEMWSWSSFRAYAYQELGPVRVNDWDMLTLKSREVESFPS